MERFSKLIPLWADRVLASKCGELPQHIRDGFAAAWNRVTESHIHRGEN